MSVREYIGARYIPLFSDPIEWDNTRSYEPLTVVINQGNSYVSKQFVPIGTELPAAGVQSNDYWLLWADFNAQIEQYRAEVATYSGRINANAAAITEEITARETSDTTIRSELANAISTVDDEIDNISTKLDLAFTSADIRTHGAIEGSMNNDWLDIIEKCNQVSDTIFFPAGKWYIKNQAIDFSQFRFSQVVGLGAEIIATEPITNMMIYRGKANPIATTTRPQSNVFGIYFHGDGYAESCLKLLNANIKIESCNFDGFTKYGIDSSNSLGKEIVNCMFGNDDATYSTTAVGAILTTDNNIVGCKFFGLAAGLELNNNNNITSCIFYKGDNNANAMIGIRPNAAQRIHGLNVTNCQFDTLDVAIEDIVSGAITSNLFMWNSVFTNDEKYTIFNFTNTYGTNEESRGIGFAFSFNEVYNLSNKIIHTFTCTALSPVSRLFYGYVSEHNSIRANNLENLLRIRIGFGTYSRGGITTNASHKLLYEPIENFDTTQGFNFILECSNIHLSATGATKIFAQFQNTGTDLAATCTAFRNTAYTPVLIENDTVPARRFGLNQHWSNVTRIESTFGFPYEARILPNADWNNETSTFTAPVAGTAGAHIFYMNGQ